MYFLLEEATTNPWITVGIFAVMIAGLYFFMIRPQKKQEKEANDMRNNLRVGDEVTTIGGIVGKIVSVREETVVIETTKDKTHIRFLRQAIRSVDVCAEDSTPPAPKAEEAAPAKGGKKKGGKKKAAPVETPVEAPAIAPAEEPAKEVASVESLLNNISNVQFKPFYTEAENISENIVVDVPSNVNNDVEDFKELFDDKDAVNNEVKENNIVNSNQDDSVLEEICISEPIEIKQEVVEPKQVNTNNIK